MAAKKMTARVKTLLVLDDLGEELNHDESIYLFQIVVIIVYYHFIKLTQCPTVIRGQVDRICMFGACSYQTKCMFGACSYLEHECLYQKVRLLNGSCL